MTFCLGHHYVEMSPVPSAPVGDCRLEHSNRGLLLFILFLIRHIITLLEKDKLNRTEFYYVYLFIFVF